MNNTPPHLPLCLFQLHCSPKVSVQVSNISICLKGNMESLTAAAWLVLRLPPPHSKPPISPRFTPS